MLISRKKIQFGAKSRGGEFAELLHCELHCQLQKFSLTEKNSSNQLFGKTIAFTKFLRQNRGSEIP